MSPCIRINSIKSSQYPNSHELHVFPVVQMYTYNPLNVLFSICFYFLALICRRFLRQSLGPSYMHCSHESRLTSLAFVWEMPPKDFVHTFYVMLPVCKLGFIYSASSRTGLYTMCALSISVVRYPRYLDTYRRYLRDDTSIAKVTIYRGISQQ